MKYTTGPWQIGHQVGDGFTVVRDVANESHNNSGRWEVLATCHSGDTSWNRQIDAGEASANAHLIAAAPELLTALKELVRYVQDEYTASHPLCERAIESAAVIAKAEGREAC